VEKKLSTTIELREMWVGDQLTEEGRIAFTARALSLVHRGHLVNGMGWEDWDDTRLSGFMSPSGQRYSPLGYTIQFLLSSLAERKKRWLYLWGEKGIGKTHLATIAGVLWTARTQRGAYLANWADWISQMQRRIGLETSHQPIPPELADAHIQTLVQTPFLVLDDVSTGHTVTTLWAMDQLYVLLNSRIGKPTVITSNVSVATYARQLIHQATSGRVNGSREVFLDIAEKVADRLGTGPGGYIARELQLRSPHGSHRQGENE